MPRVILRTGLLLVFLLVACSQEPYELDDQSLRELDGALPDVDRLLAGDRDQVGHELGDDDVGAQGPLVGEPADVAPRPSAMGVSLQALEVAGSPLVPVKDTTRMPQRTTVRLEVTWTRGGEPSVCSGTLIANDAVLTAAHCLYKAERGGFAYSIVAVPAGQGDARPFGQVGVRRSFVPNKYRALAQGSERYSLDFGVARLKRAFSVGTRSVAVASEPLNVAFTVRGYPGVKNDPRYDGTRMFESRDRVRSLLSNGVFYHGASTQPGMSGAGVDDGAQIIGVHCASAEGDNSGVIFGNSSLNTVNRWATQVL
jgi:V8-like Glu-specific endopeptidase